MKPNSSWDSSLIGERTLSDYIAILRRRYKVIVLSTVGVAVIAFLVSSQQAKVFQATTDVLLSRRDIGAELAGVSNPSLVGDPARLAQTDAEIANSTQVANLAIRLSGVSGLSASTFLANSSATPQLNADVLRFTVKNADPAQAAHLSNAFAQAFTQYKLTLDTAAITEARKQLTSRMRALEKTGDTFSDLYKNLLENEQQLRTMQLLQTLSPVLESPEVGAQVAPTPKRTAFFGAMLGLLVGLALAFLWEALDKRMRSGKQIEDVLGLPLLGRLPKPSRQLQAHNRLAMIDEPTGGYAEAVRMLRSNLEAANVEVGAQTILVTSYGQREGKSTTVANLAVALARSGKNVALVDLDLRQPMMAAFFSLPERVGITDVVLEGASLKAAMNPVGVSAASSSSARRGAANQSGRLTVLPVGRSTESPWELTSSDALGDVLAQLRSDFDLVFVDAPPMGLVGDAKAIAPFVDALLVVARQGLVELTDLENLVRELGLVAAAKLGFVLTGVDAHETTYDAKGTGAVAGPSVEAREVAPVGQLHSRRAHRKAPWVAAPPPRRTRDADADTP